MAAECTSRVSVGWTPSRTGLAKCESSPQAIHFSEAAELGGLEGRWTPEQLLLCALAGSFTTTFVDLARGLKFDYTDLEVEIEGSVRPSGTAARSFNEILIRARLTVNSEEQCESALNLLRRTKSACMISRAITVPQKLEPTVDTAKVLIEGWSAEDTAELGV